MNDIRFHLNETTDFSKAEEGYYIAKVSDEFIESIFWREKEIDPELKLTGNFVLVKVVVVENDNKEIHLVANEDGDLVLIGKSHIVPLYALEQFDYREVVMIERGQLRVQYHSYDERDSITMEYGSLADLQQMFHIYISKLLQFPLQMKYVLIASGGSLKRPKVKHFTLSEDDPEIQDFGSFKEYCYYVFNEKIAEYNQVFANATVMSNWEWDYIIRTDEVC